MKYRIRIEQEDITKEDDYERYTQIYEQKVEDLDVRAVVNLINRFRITKIK